MSSFKPVRGEVMRATVTDECGVPATGTGDSIVTDGFVTVSFSPENRDRDEIELPNAAGAICVTDTIAPQLKWFNVEAEFCEVCPDLFAKLTGQEVVENFDSSDVIGLTIGADPSDNGFALEVWSGTDTSDVACGTGGVPFGYFLVPWLTEGTIEEFTIENDAITFTITARTNSGHSWGAGPYDVVEQDAADPPTAGPLTTPLAASKQLLFLTTTVDPPATTPCP